MGLTLLQNVPGFEVDAVNAIDAYPTDAWRLLSPLLTSERRARLEHVAKNRTSHIRLVVQDVHDPHNVSACMRSADAFGVQNVDVVTLREPFRASTVARGVAAWLTVSKFQDVAECAAALKRQGYWLCTALPSASATPLMELPVKKPIAVIFGNEHHGVDSNWQGHIDQAFTIPMSGMVESLNISVSAAITLQFLTQKARAELGPSFLMAEAERLSLLNAWACQQFRSWPEMLKNLRNEALGPQQT